LWYWRDGNKEIDLILRKGKQVVAIEVKAGNRLSSSGLTTFKNHYEPCTKILVGTEGLIWKDFIKRAHLERFYQNKSCITN
jgi:predicted AAA+ superfamily ATPase